MPLENTLKDTPNRNLVSPTRIERVWAMPD
jgi:hypothetical protein